MKLIASVAITALLAAGLVLCGCGYRDTYTPGGVPNFYEFAPGMYQSGLPTTPAAWADLRLRVERDGKSVTRVVLHDATEGDESPAAAFGWHVVLVPMPPEDDRPLTIFATPRPEDVTKAVDTILSAHRRGDTVVWGCVHGRDRTNYISALVGEEMLDWTSSQAWHYQLDHGSRIEVLPGLLFAWETRGAQ